jgi:hypothetical protein
MDHTKKKESEYRSARDPEETSSGWEVRNVFLITPFRFPKFTPLSDGNWMNENGMIVLGANYDWQPEVFDRKVRLLDHVHCKWAKILLRYFIKIKEKLFEMLVRIRQAFCNHNFH